MLDGDRQTLASARGWRAPRRLFTSFQGGTGEAGLSVDEWEEEPQHAGQSRGERGLRPRGSKEQRAALA